jgi:hypothetical protein
MQKSVLVALFGVSQSKHLVSRNKLEPLRDISISNNYSISSWVSDDGSSFYYEENFFWQYPSPNEQE